MLWWILIWAVVVAALCGLAFLLLVAQAFGRQPNPLVKTFIATVLGPGLKLADGNPYVLLPLMWAMWTAIGVGAIVVVRHLAAARPF